VEKKESLLGRVGVLDKTKLKGKNRELVVEQHDDGGQQLCWIVVSGRHNYYCVTVATLHKKVRRLLGGGALG